MPLRTITFSNLDSFTLPSNCFFFFLKNNYFKTNPRHLTGTFFLVCLSHTKWIFIWNIIMLTKWTVLSQNYRLPTPHSDFTHCPRKLSLIVGSFKSKSKQASRTAVSLTSLLIHGTFWSQMRIVFALRALPHLRHHGKASIIQDPGARERSPPWMGVVVGVGFRLLLHRARTDYGWFNVQEGSCWKTGSFSFQVGFVLNLD